jgi:hypothetical protein
MENRRPELLRSQFNDVGIVGSYTRFLCALKITDVTEAEVFTFISVMREGKGRGVSVFNYAPHHAARCGGVEV